MSNESKPSFLDTPLVTALKLDMEKGLYLLFTLAAVFTRFWRLGDRVMSHDESLHAYFSWGLYMGRGFQHTPLMHGPFLFHINALIYSLFGADDFTARISAALFGVALVLLPWTLRRWLGRAGALVTSFLFLISPMILYHARYIRNESYVTVWVMLALWAMFAYLRDRQAKWLYLFVAANVLHFASKEVAFIYTAILGSFLMLLIVVEIVRSRGWGWDGLARAMAAAAGVLAVLVLGSATQLALLVMRDLGPTPASAAGGAAASPALATMDVTINFVMLAVVGALWGLAAFGVLRALLPEGFREVPTFDLAVLLGAFYLPALSPFAIKLAGFDPVDYGQVGIVRSWGILVPFLAVSFAVGLWWNWRRFLIAAGAWYGIFITLFTTIFTNGAGLATGMIGSMGYWLAQQAVQRGSQPPYYYFILVLLYEYLPLLISAIAIVVYTARGFRFPVQVSTPTTPARDNLWTLLAVGACIASAIRLFFLLIKVSGPLTLVCNSFILLCFVALIVLFVQGRGAPKRMPGSGEQRKAPKPKLPAVPEKIQPEDAQEAWKLENEITLFAILLVYWIGMTWVIYSYAGEKMPWLTVHFALPMILLAGHFLGGLFERIDWKDTARGWLVALLVPLFLIAFAGMIGALGAGAFRGKELAQLTATSQWLSAFVIAIGALIALTVVVPKVGWERSARVLGLEALGLLVILTVRTAWMWNYINYDDATEFGVYAHGGPGVKIAMRQIDDISQRIAGDHALKIAYDSDASWPFSWYLRDYTNAVFVPNNPTRDQLSLPVIVGGSASWTTFEPILGDKYDKFTYRLIWWPMEDYKGKNGKILTAAEVAEALSNPQMLRAFWSIWLNRDYKLYDQLTGKTHTPDKWPLAHDFRLYVRKDISNQIWDQRIGPIPSTSLPTDPYLKIRRDVAAVQVLGASGPGDGQAQFNAPHGLAIAPDGSLYVADSNNHRIQKFDASKFLLAFGTYSGPNNPNPPPGTFNEPWGIAVGPDGSVYVADTWNHRIQKFDPNGNFLKAWGTAGQTDMNGQTGIFWGPRDVAVGKDGRVYVTDTGNKRIQVFDADGVFLTQFGGAGVEPGRLDEPVGLAIDPSDNLVVNDTWNQRIQVLSPDGRPIRQWEVKGWLDQSVTNKPYVAVDRDGNIYTTDPTGFRVLVFAPDGTPKATFGDLGTDEKSFQLPIGIAVDGSGNVYVSDAELGRILKFPPLQ